MQAKPGANRYASPFSDLPPTEVLSADAAEARFREQARTAMERMRASGSSARALVRKKQACAGSAAPREAAATAGEKDE
jgi:hypothetical protein